MYKLWVRDFLIVEPLKKYCNMSRDFIGNSFNGINQAISQPSIVGSGMGGAPVIGVENSGLNTNNPLQPRQGKFY